VLQFVAGANPRKIPAVVIVDAANQTQVRVAVHCSSAMECVAVCCTVLQCVALFRSVLQCAAVCCSVLQCVAVCCSVL